MKYRVENGSVSYETQTSRVRFDPKGKGRLFGRNPADVTVYGVPKNAARMFVGFNVGQTPAWSVDSLAVLFRHFRALQSNDDGKVIPIDASFVIQKGFYTSETDGVVYENSAQLVVLSLWGESEQKFTDNMIEIAGHIARELMQDVVILEIQRSGVPHEVYGVGWKENVA